MCVGVLLACMPVYHMSASPLPPPSGGQKRASDDLILELKTVVSNCVSVWS